MGLIHFLKKFKDDHKGISGIIVGLIITLVLVAIIIPVGLLATATIKTTVDAMDLGTAGNATRTTLFSNIFAAFDLSVIVPIIAGAALVIGAVTAGFAYKRMR